MVHSPSQITNTKAIYTELLRRNIRNPTCAGRKESMAVCDR